MRSIKRLKSRFRQVQLGGDRELRKRRELLAELVPFAESHGYDTGVLKAMANE